MSQISNHDIYKFTHIHTQCKNTLTSHKLLVENLISTSMSQHSALARDSLDQGLNKTSNCSHLTKISSIDLVTRGAIPRRTKGWKRHGRCLFDGLSKGRVDDHCMTRGCQDLYTIDWIREAETQRETMGDPVGRSAAIVTYGEPRTTGVHCDRS